MYDIYTIQSGDTIEKIANRYNITPYILYQLNGFTPNYKLNEGDTLIVPKVRDTYFDYYTIKKGDNLYKKANKYNIDQNVLALINGLDLDDYIYPNQVISVPKNDVKYYITKEDDTIGKIANNLNTNMEEILNQNKEIFLLPEQLIVYKEK